MLSYCWLLSYNNEIAFKMSATKSDYGLRNNMKGC